MNIPTEALAPIELVPTRHTDVEVGAAIMPMRDKATFGAPPVPAMPGAIK